MATFWTLTIFNKKQRSVQLDCCSGDVTSRMVPTDSTGHALPPPVPAEELCLLPPSQWARYWTQWRKHQKVPCCLCGRWVDLRGSYAGSRALLGPKAQRLLNTRLEDLFYCSACRRKCRKCNKYICDEQIRQRGFCELCRLK